MNGQYSNGDTDNVANWFNFAQLPREQGGLGLAKHQAAGLVGNLVNESGQSLNPWGPTGDNGTAWGTAQWRGDRLQNLQNFAQSQGLDHRSMEAQQAFMRHEFDTSENGAYKALLAAQSPEDAANAVNHMYERSADTSGNRAASARAIFDGTPLSAINSAAGIKSPGRGVLTSAFAAPDNADDGEEDTGALSTNNTVGAGALSPAALSKTIMSGDKSDNKLNVIGQGLTGLGASLAGISSPGQAYALTNQLAQMKKDNESKYKVVVGKNGEIIRVDQDGNVQVANPSGTSASGSPPMLGDPSKSGDEYLKTLDPVDRAMVSDWLEGKGIMPTAYQLKNPKTFQLLAAAKQVDPDFDIQKLKGRITMQADLAKSNPASLGGILANGASAFRHLGLSSDTMAGLQNNNGYDGFGGNIAGQAANAVQNYGASAERATRLAAANEEISKYGTESTKYYAGSPGGVHERAAAQKATDPWTATGAAQAGYIDASKNLMIERGKELEAHIRETMGQRYLDKHPVFSDEQKALIARIEKNVATLKGNTGSSSSPSDKKRPPLDTLIPLN